MTQTTPAPSFRLSPGARLALWAQDDPDLQAVAELLTGWFSLKRLDDLPAPGPEGLTEPLLLLCRSPVGFISRALEQDADAASVLEDWQTRVTPALALNRRNREHVHLVDADMICSDPAAFLHRFGLDEKDGAIAALAALAGPPPDPTLQLLARQGLYSGIATRTLASEFDAVSVNLQPGETAGSNPAEMFLQAYRERQDERNELELLRAQQQSMYEQLETLYAEKLQAEQRLDQLNSGIESYQTQIETIRGEQQELRDRVAERDRDIEGMRGRMAVKDTILRSAGRMLREAELQAAARDRKQAGDVARLRAQQAEEVAGQVARTEALQAEIDRILNSRSYRLLAPLRRVRALLSGQR